MRSPVFSPAASAGVPPSPALPPTDVASGLSRDEVARRLATFGYNEVPEARESATLRLLRKFWGPTPWMLELTAALTWALGRVVETAVVLALLAFNGALAYVNERRADAALGLLRERLQILGRVRRGGAWASVPARELVPGDIVRLRAGDVAPADVRLADGALEVDASALTGESLPVEAGPGGLAPSGSTVVRGEATGVVAATGARTVYGRTVELVALARPKLRMEAVVSGVVRGLLLLVGALVLVALAVAAVRGIDLVATLPLAAILLLSAVPVALPTMFAISMALGALELARKGVLVTRLAAGEDAAGMDILCVDKTGTITANRLSVADVVPVGGRARADVLRLAALASQEANADPIDLAVLAAAREAGAGPEGWVQERFVPFDPATRRTEVVAARGGERIAAAKGAVGAILASARVGGEELAVLLAEVEGMSRKGHRVLAVASGPSAGELQVAGLLALADRPRPDSAALVRELHGLGIRVKMLTGDALPVAREVAAEIGLAGPVVRMPPKDALGGAGFEAVEAAAGVAEVYPEDKYRIVRGLQDRGHVVGMTGDGVNDAPALRQAEAGIAVRSATDIAKRSASVVLTQDGLGGIVDLVAAGRRIHQRITTWVLNKVVKTFQVVVFVVAAFLLTREYVVSVFGMVLFLFVTDFVTLSLSTDTVSVSRTPDTWHLRGLGKVGVALGVFVVAESLLLLYAGGALLGLADVPRLQTFVFDGLVFLGVLGVLILRERGRFWASRPSRTLAAFVAADVALVAALSLVGLPGLPAIPPAAAGFALAFSAAATFLVNDALKVALFRRFVPWR